MTLRLCLGLICAYALFIGLTATVAPRAFYDDFPFLAHWVDRLPPFNEHLITDVGELYLGFAVLFGWAVRRPERTLVLASCTAFLAVAVLHFAFHAAHLDGFPVADAVGELVALAVLLVPPVAAIRLALKSAPA